jgi:tetratricopeptide (TPR) repeat protein
MTSEARTSLVIVALLIAVVAVSFFYSRSVRVGNEEAAAAILQTQERYTTPIDLPPALLEGQRALSEGRFDEALERFRSVPPGDPAHAVALQHQALVEERRGEPQRALELFVEIAGLEPENPEVHVQLAHALYLVGRVAEAEFAALRALELAPRHGPARYDVALYRVAQDRLPEAIEAYHRAVALSGDRETAERAMAALERLHERRPELPAVHYALAFFGSTLGLAEREREELEHYLAGNPQGATAERARERLASLSPG